MKCTNCGANYDAMMERCPYCNTVNQKKTFFKKRKNAAQMQYNAVKQRWEPKIQKKTVNQVLNKVLIIEAMVVLALFVLTGIIGIIEEASYSTGVAKNMSKSECKAEIKRLYEAEEFDKMTNLYNDTDIIGDEDIRLQISMAVFYNSYQRFVENRIEYMEGVKEDDIDDSTINSLIRQMNSVLEKKDGDYVSEYDKANEKYFSKYREDVEAFARGILKLTDDEIKVLKESSYIDDKAETKLRKAIKARRSYSDAE